MDDSWGEEICEFDRMALRDDHLGKPFVIRWGSGKEVDEKLMMLLHSFRELYIKQGEFFKQIFPEMLHGAFADVFKKLDAVVRKKDQLKMRALTRSLSVGSSRGLKIDDESELKLERFKVRTPNLSGAQPGGQGGKGGQGGGVKVSK